MAISIVNDKQTKGGIEATLTITAATAGNVLVAFVNTSTTTEPTQSGWTTEKTVKALREGSAQSLWLMYKTAAGGETKIEPTGATVTGICYFELSGASTTIDAITHTDNTAAKKNTKTTAITTTDAGDILLACVGLINESETVEAWTVQMENVETTTTRNIGGHFLPGGIVTAGTYQANWLKSRASCNLIVAFKPSAGGKKTGEGSATIAGGGVAAPLASAVIRTGSAALFGGGHVAVGSAVIRTGSAVIRGGGTVFTVSLAKAVGSAAVSGGGALFILSGKLATGSAAIHGGGFTSGKGGAQASGSAAIRSGGKAFAPAAVRIGQGSAVVSAGGHVFTVSMARAVGTAVIAGGGRSSLLSRAIALGSAVLHGGSSPFLTGGKLATGSAVLSGGGHGFAKGTRIVFGPTVVLTGGAHLFGLGEGIHPERALEITFVRAYEPEREPAGIGLPDNDPAIVTEQLGASEGDLNPEEGLFPDEGLFPGSGEGARSSMVVIVNVKDL